MRVQTVLTSLELSISHVSRVISREIVCKSTSNQFFSLAVFISTPTLNQNIKKERGMKMSAVQRKRQHVSHGLLSHVASWALRFYGCGRRWDAASWQC